MTTTSTSTNHTTLLKSQLEREGRRYLHKLEGSDSIPHQKLLQVQQQANNNCRDVLSAVVPGDILADVFIKAAERNHIDILQFFVDNGVNVNIKDRFGWTAFRHLCMKDHEESARLLLNHARAHANIDENDVGDVNVVDVDSQANHGDTVLMGVSSNGLTKFVTLLLLEENANVDIQDQSGHTALMCASQHGHADIVALLLLRNADTQLQNEFGETAFDIAKTSAIKDMLSNHVNSHYLLK